MTDRRSPPRRAGQACDPASMLAWIKDALAPDADRFDAEGAFPAEVVRAMGAQGLLGAAVPAAFGGSYLGAREQGDVCEALGQASASALSLFTVHSMVATALARLGSRLQRDTWLPKLATGAAVAAFALSEPDAGSDAESVRTTFVRKGNRLIVNGVKSWVSFGQIADVILVVGRLDGKVVAVLVPADAPGTAIVPTSGMFGFRAGMLATVTFDDVPVAASDLIGSADFGLAQIVGLVLDQGRHCIGWGCVGLAHACLEASVRYCSDRVQFGRPLTDFQLVQGMIADMMVDTHAARLMCIDAARSRDARSPDMLVRTAAAKYAAARAADRAAGTALHLHGANGCSDRYPVQRYLRDAKVMNIIEGSNEIQQILLAQHARMWTSTSREFVR